MEPSTKKRKLAPKVNASPAANSQAAASQHGHELPQHYAAQEGPVSERQDFESFARHLQDAAMLIQRQTERHPYSEVSVLLLSWEEDSTFRDDLAALAHVLQKQYNYSTQAWQIPTVANPSIKLGVQMASFLEHARPNHLQIIYYAGHSYMGSDGHLYWACNAQEDAARLKWDGVRCLFEDAQSDIILLLDGCAVPDPPAAGSHGIKLGIAAYVASAEERRVREGSSGRSFTSMLVDALRNLNTGRQFSVQQLYDEILSQAQLRISQATKPANGGSPRGAGAPSRDQLPVFFTLTPGENQSVTLAPLPSRSSGGQSQNGREAADGQSIRDREDQLIDPEMVTDLRFDEARILVCTTFVGDASPDMTFFNQWLQNTPPLGSRIAVEGMFLGPPTMLLISMPQSVWNVVQHDKVCCFLGYVSSHNMIHLYEKLVGPSGVRPSVKQVEEGKILLEARELAAGTTRLSRDVDHHESPYHSSGDRPDVLMHNSPPRPAFGLPSTKPKNEVEDSAEMQEAAEQLKALSHVRHRSDEAISSGGDQRRTALPESAVEAARDKTGLSRGAADLVPADSNMLIDIKTAPSSRMKGPRRSIPKETRCGHCTHAPFKDSSSLRKHIAAAHTRPFPCAFSFAGCTSTFGSKNEWKRHIASQHLCLQYYRCSSCPPGAMEGKGNEFNRKDLFTQHLRRMHAPFQIKRASSQNDGQLQSDWEAQVKELQQSCLVTRRKPPQRASCPKSDCRKEFEGVNAWDEWTEHVGRHMEKGEGPVLGVDEILTQWALDEKIIEPSENGEYRLCATNGLLGSSQSSGLSPMLDRNNSMHMSFTDTSQIEDTSMTDAKPVEPEAPAGQAPNTQSMTA